MKPGSKDIKIHFLIAGEELSELQRHTYLMGDAYGLDARIEKYKGKRPIGLYRWDLDCLIDVIDIALNDNDYCSDKENTRYDALKNLSNRLKDEYRKNYD